MFLSLKRKVLCGLVDFFLFVTVFFGGILSYNFLGRILIISFLIFGLGRGFFVESKEKLLFPPRTFTAMPAKTEYKRPVVKKADTKFPLVSAQAVLVMDVLNDTVLYERRPDVPLAPASTTKLMTALVSLDVYKPNEIVTISKECVDIEGNKAYFYVQEQILFEDLMHALLISSANDAACVLGSAKSSWEEFVALMNDKANNLGLKNTHFTNPIGFDSETYTHYSTAQDLYRLALEARSDPWLREIYERKEYDFVSGIVPRKIYSTNQLLWHFPQSVGIKTGTTHQAGEVLIYEYADSDKDLIIIIMGSSNRFLETRQILDWVFDKYVWI